MRVAQIVDEMPSVTQTFVLAQIAGAIAAGCDVSIFADSADSAAAGQLDADSHDLMKRVTYFGLPLRKVRESAGRVRASSSPGASAPDESSFGRRIRNTAKAARLSFEGRAFAGQPRFDVIHAHFGPNGTRAVKLRRASTIQGPVITSFYGYDVGRKRVRGTYADLFNSGEKFIALSDHMRAGLIGLGAPEERTIVHRLGVDVDRFVPVERRGSERLEILSIARLVEKKGIEYALRGVSEFARSGAPYRYTIVGDGPLRLSLERLANDLGISGKVVFAGAKSSREIVTMLQQSDLLLAPSVTAEDGDVEGTPVAIIEAQSCALPVVTTRHAGIPEIINDAKSGFLLPERDSQSIGEALTKLSESPSLRESMGSAGRAIVTAKYSIHTLNGDLVRLYEQTRNEGLR